MDKSVTMSTQEWQTLVNLLGAKCLFNECAPLIGKIMQQLNAPPSPGNGDADPKFRHATIPKEANG